MKTLKTMLAEKRLTEKVLLSIAEKQEAAIDLAVKLNSISQKLAWFANDLASDADMLDVYFSSDLATFEELANTIEMKLEIFNDLPVEDLATALKLNVTKTKATKDDMKKALGL